VSGMRDLAGTSSYLNVIAISLVSGPSRSSEKQGDVGDDYYEIIFTVEWRD